MKIIQGDNYNPEKRIYPNNFIGPSSTTLQIENIVPINENANIPNIRKEYTVTDKADGERNMLFVSSNGKIYLINSNMVTTFTGAKTETKELFNSLVDGEIVLHNKNGEYINLYIAIDVYFIDKLDVRSYGFMPKSKEDVKSKFRLPLLKMFIRQLNPISIMKNQISPIRIESKNFYPLNPNDSIFDACNFILDRVKQGLFEYNTDGLIFTPASMGVGASEIGKAGPLKKDTWIYSFKWKPAYYNTIDFLVTTKKSEKGLDVVTPLFQSGLQTSSMTQINEYKTIILRCGFNENKHGYINPCQDVINDVIPDYDEANKKDYKYFETGGDFNSRNIELDDLVKNSIKLDEHISVLPNIIINTNYANKKISNINIKYIKIIYFKFIY
jgi:hypothetical protein